MINNIYYLVVFAIYDGGISISFMEHGRIKDLYTYKQVKDFKERFGKSPEDITIEDLAKHYLKIYIIVFCDNGCIQYSRGTKE